MDVCTRAKIITFAEGCERYFWYSWISTLSRKMYFWRSELCFALGVELRLLGLQALWLSKFGFYPWLGKKNGWGFREEWVPSAAAHFEGRKIKMLAQVVITDFGAPFGNLFLIMWTPSHPQDVPRYVTGTTEYIWKTVFPYWLRPDKWQKFGLKSSISASWHEQMRIMNRKTNFFVFSKNILFLLGCDQRQNFRRN